MPTPEEVLTIGFDLDITGALKDLATFQKKMHAQMSAVTGTVDKLSKANEKMAKKAAKGTREWQDTIDEVEGSVDKLSAVMADMERRAKKASGTRKQELLDHIELLKKMGAQRKKDEKKGKGDDGGGALPGAGSGAAKAASRKEAKRIGGDIFGGMKGGLSSLFQKDLGGVFTEGSKTLGSVMEGSGKLFGGLFKKGGRAFGDQAGGFLMRKAGKQWGKGGVKGKAGGAGLAAAGGAMKAVGGMFKAIGPLLGTLAKIGPLLGTVSTALVGIVKLVVDAESQAKDFNKSILQAAGSSGFLAKNFGDADLAMADMDSTLRQIRDAAHDKELLFDWGIDPEQHAAILNVMTQEGLELSDMAEMARQAGTDVQGLQKELAKVSVGFSRSMGVPLQEINQMQVEMMRNMGASLDETKLAFAQMTRAAGESGIAANRFFQVIKGVSQDLALYNTRMGSATKLLKEIGKVMDPRSAQKFMQFATQGLKSMDQDARMRLDMLSGGKGKAIVEKDLTRKEGLLLKRMNEITGETVESIQAQLEGGALSREKMFEKLRTGGTGVDEKGRKIVRKEAASLIESSEEMKIDRSAVGKGQYGVAAAMGNLSAGGSLNMMRAGMTKFSGAKSISEGIGTIGQDKMAQMLGVSEEQVRQMAKLEMHLIRQREVLKDKLDNGTDQDKADAQKALDDAGMTREQLDSNQIDFAALMETLSDKEKEETRTEAEKQMTVAQHHSDLTDGILKQLERLVSFLMNEFYNVILDIWDAILDPLGMKKEEMATKRAVMETKDPAMIKAMKGMGENIDAYALRGKASEVYGGKLSEKTQTEEGRKEVLAAAQSTLKGGDIMAAGTMAGVDQAKMDKLRGKLFKKVSAAEAGVPSAVGPGMGPGGVGGMPDITVPIEGADFTKAMQEAGLTGEEIGRLLEKGIWGADPSRAVAFAGAVGGAGGVAPTEAEKKKAKEEGKAKAQEEAKQAPPPPSPQAQAAAKTAGAPTGVTASTTAPDLTPMAAPGKPRVGTTQVSHIRPGAAAGTMEGKAEEIPATAKGQGQLHEDMGRLEKRLTTKGIKYDKSFLTGDYGTEIEKRVLDAMRVALVEFALYKDLEKEDLVKGIKAGDPKTFGKSIMEAAQAAEDPAKFAKNLGAAGGGKGGKKSLFDRLLGRQEGGLVIGQNPDGTAKVMKPPAKEMITAIGAGEGIMSKSALAAAAGGKGGGGGIGSIQVNVNGPGGRELARMMEVAAIDVVHEFERKKGMT